MKKIIITLTILTIAISTLVFPFQTGASANFTPPVKIKSGQTIQGDLSKKKGILGDQYIITTENKGKVRVYVNILTHSNKWGSSYDWDNYRSDLWFSELNNSNKSIFTYFSESATERKYDQYFYVTKGTYCITIQCSGKYTLKVVDETGGSNSNIQLYENFQQIKDGAKELVANKSISGKFAKTWEFLPWLYLTDPWVEPSDYFYINKKENGKLLVYINTTTGNKLMPFRTELFDEFGNEIRWWDKQKAQFKNGALNNGLNWWDAHPNKSASAVIEFEIPKGKYYIRVATSDDSPAYKYSIKAIER